MKKFLDLGNILKSLNKNSYKILAIIFMAIACGLVLFTTFTYHVDGESWFFIPISPGYDAKGRLSVDAMQAMYAIFLYSPCMFRNFNRKETMTFSNLCMHVLNLLFISVLICIMFKGFEEGKLIPIINLPVQSFLLIAIALSWLGVRAVAGYAWIIVALFSITTFSDTAISLKSEGWICVICGYLSILFQLVENNFGVDNLNDLFYEIRGIGTRHGDRIKGDLGASWQLTKSAGANIKNSATKYLGHK